MTSTIEKIEKNVATIKIEVSAEDFNKAINQSYKKNKASFNIPGFRKGKAPRIIIERQYGSSVFYEDAIDFAFPEAYSKAIDEHDLFPVARPEMENIDSISATEGLTMVINVAIKPEVELGEYKGTEIGKLDYEVTDEDLEEELVKLQNQNARLVSAEDTEAKEGDTAIIDFEGFDGDVAFEGGSGENYSLVLGSKTFIPGFEEQLIGTKAGEEKDVNVSFPEDYHVEDLAGKPVVFKVKVNELKVKELPELDDEFVKDISEFDTLDEFKEDLKVKIKDRKTKELRDAAEAELVKVAVSNATMEIPEPMINEELDKTLQNFEYRMQMQGINLEDYFAYTNTTAESLKEEVREDTIEKIKTDLVLSKITEVESIEAPEEAIEKEMENYAKMYQVDLEKIKATKEQREYFESIVKRRETLGFLVNNAVQK